MNNTLSIVKKAVEALRDKKAEDVKVIDITEVSSVADYFIIANGIIKCVYERCVVIRP